MKRRSVNFIIDGIGFTGFVFLTATGVLVRYILPPGSGHHTTLWGLDRHEWGTLHFWIAISFLCILALHLFLHWGWIVRMIQGKPREGSGVRFLLGLVGILAVLAIAIAPFWSSVERTGTGGAQKRRISPLSEGSQRVRGRMTLTEIGQETGVPTVYLIERLGLPREIPLDEGVGRLGRRFGFDIDDVRRIVLEYKAQE